ncbi:MAG TPA: cupin domain-containing protein [Acidimicrobiales bacterium]|jgi:quercetin dioxygenase-like cupin family protein|nr:cupin domain-containing protein [Acidimicrobiales bacterium]
MNEVWHAGGRLAILADAASTEGRFGVVDEQLPAGATAPVHIHANEDEVFIVLDGRMRFWRGDEVIDAAPGSVVVLPRGVAHSFVVDSERARTLNLVTPAGFEAFFRMVGDVPTHDGLPEPGTDDIEKLVAAAASLDVSIVGPPPGVPA